MIPYIFRRLANAVVLAFLVTFVTFALIAPSEDSVVRSLLGTGATHDSVVAMKERLGYDQPLIVQYFNWLSNVLHGNFGDSVFTGAPVESSVVQRLSVTLSIVLVALVISVVLSLTFGVLAATRGGALDRILQGVSLVGTLIPGLLLAIVLVLVFAVTLHWLPATGYTAPSDNFGKWAASITLPVIALTVGSTASMSAQVRGSMIDELRKDYVRTLRTRGVGTTEIVLKHALRNAAGPALTVLGFEFVTMLGAALFIEQIFALPGYGTFSFNAALQGDIPVIMGVAVFGVFLVVSINLVVDILNGLLTPKARLY